MWGIEQWASLAEIAGSIVVVATLIFLAVQLRQHNQLLKSESRKAQLSNDQTSILIGLDHPEVWAMMHSPEPLSQRDQFRLSAAYLIDMRNREFEFFQYKNGELDEAAWKAYREIIRFNHATKRGRRWWDTVGRGVFDPEFVETVDNLLAESPPNDTMLILGNWDETNPDSSSA